MSVISIRFNNEEEILKKYLETKSTNISQYVKELIFNSIEEEYDLEILRDYEKRKADGTLKLISHEELKKELGT